MIAGFIIDGLPYDHYPDEQERIANLTADRDKWQRLAIRETARRMKAERR